MVEEDGFMSMMMVEEDGFMSMMMVEEDGYLHDGWLKRMDMCMMDG